MSLVSETWERYRKILIRILENKYTVFELSQEEAADSLNHLLTLMDLHCPEGKETILNYLKDGKEI